jgi:proline iminopeptidase
MAYGRWAPAAQAHYAAEAEQMNGEALQIFNSDGAFDPAATREGLTKVDAPSLLLAGELDSTVASAEFADLFPNAQLVVQRGAGHFPWLYDLAAFVTGVAQFLD